MIRYVTYLMGMVLLMLLTGCVTRNAPDTNYFSLFSLEQMGSTVTMADSPSFKIGIGPVNLADSLRRSQIVTRSNSNQYAFDEYNKWAGPLEKDLAITVGNNLAFLTGASSVDYYPWQPYFHPTHRVVIGIERLDGELGGEVVLEARWSIVSPDGKKTLKEQRTVYRRTAAGAGYPDLVLEESLLIGDLCRDIAEGIKQ